MPAGTNSETEQPAGSRRLATSDDVEISTYLEIAAASSRDEARPAGAEVAGGQPAVREAVAVIDFGSQYTQLIARRVREAHVYCEILPHDATLEQVRVLKPRGLILSGGPASVYADGAPQLPPWTLRLGVPVLGICYGQQLLANALGGEVAPGDKAEYGPAELVVSNAECPIFKGLPITFPVWMSHGDTVMAPPPGFRTLAHTGNSAVAAMACDGIIGLQFHPEVAHTPLGREIIKNFLYEICGCRGTWTPGSFVEETVEAIRRRVGTKRVVCALSGGVDSAVAATLVHRAVGDQLTCIFVNNGLLRRDEPERVLRTFRSDAEGTPRLNLVYVDASDRFLARLEGVTDPERKRMLIGETFIRVFEDEARKLGKADFLVQGTLYPDVIESKTRETKAAARIKTHHNVGGLPEDIAFDLIEPLRYLFKDEVRAVGLELGLPEDMVYRQPFPGPGLAIRVIGEVTRERLETLRACDWIVVNEIKKAKYYRQVWQSFAVLTPIRSVGVMGDGRTYQDVVALRCVASDDGMTADWARLPYDLLARISNRIVNEVPGVNRVVFDITSKPPGTIEWE